jgi:hypothetical protein
MCIIEARSVKENDVAIGVIRVATFHVLNPFGARTQIVTNVSMIVSDR